MTDIIVPDLKALASEVGVADSTGIRLTWVDDVKGRSALKIEPTKTEYVVSDEWIVRLSAVTFADGEIEFDALGQSDPPQSNFLGVAFRLVDDQTHDAVYFRPFNFRAEDPDRKSHAIQYVSHPEHRWWILRENTPGVYEKPIDPAPDGDAWFHARIVVEWPQVRVFVNGAAEPSLVVEGLSRGEGTGVGLWVGPRQGGYFANLRITPAHLPQIS